METAEIERELRQFLHSVRRNSGPPNPHIELSENPPIELREYLSIFQNLVESSREKYAGLMPAVILTGDVMPANFNDSEIATKYLSRVLDALEGRLIEKPFDCILKALRRCHPYYSSSSFSRRHFFCSPGRCL